MRPKYEHSRDALGFGIVYEVNMLVWPLESLSKAWPGQQLGKNSCLVYYLWIEVAAWGPNRVADSQTVRQSDPNSRQSDTQTVRPEKQTIRQSDSQTRQADSQTLRQSDPAGRQSDNQTVTPGTQTVRLSACQV